MQINPAVLKGAKQTWDLSFVWAITDQLFRFFTRHFTKTHGILDKITVKNTLQELKTS